MIRQVVPLNYNQNDEEARLIHLALDDPTLFAPLYERYVDRIFAYCSRRVSDHQTAEDLCSQIFVQAIQGLHNFDPAQGVFAGWLYAIARNIVAGYYRKHRTIIPIDAFEIPDETSLSLDEMLDDTTNRELLGYLVDTLSEDKKNLLRLVLNPDLTSEDVGDIVNKSANAVRVEFHRIVKTLRRRYQQMLGEGQ